jgi:ubiquinone/menaquinone biosynthesis C-methylase UbiE
MNSAGEFDRFSEKYEELHNKNVSITGETGEYFAAYKARYIAAMIVPRPGCKILDYGCGVGLLSKQLKEQLPHARVDGYDVSQGSLDRINPELKLQGTFTCRPRELVERSYDVVVLANVLHHVKPQDRQDIISEAGGKLGRSGKLAVFEHNPANPLTRWAVEHCPFDENAILLPPRETMGYFTRGGFQQVCLRYIVFFPRTLKWLRPAERALGWCPIGAQYVVSGVQAGRP